MASQPNLRPKEDWFQRIQDKQMRIALLIVSTISLGRFVWSEVGPVLTEFWYFVKSLFS